jgi:hypothetical protein
VLPQASTLTSLNFHFLPRKIGIDLALAVRIRLNAKEGVSEDA